MAIEIHKTAIVADGATLGKNVKVGPFSIIGPDVTLGDNVELISHVTLSGKTTLGADCKLFPYVSMGHPPQDFKHKGGPVSIEIGPRCTFREYVNIHPGTDIGVPITRIGHDCYFMVGTHLAHECQMGNHVIVSNGAQIGGHVTIGDHVILGGLCAVHQHSRIGAYAFVAGMATVVTDIIPYGFVTGNPAKLGGLNIVGLKRMGLTRDEVHVMRTVYRQIFSSGDTFSERLDMTAKEYGQNERVMEIIDFINNREDRSICMPVQGR